MEATSFAPNGIVTLTTDFGLDDPYVGMMKGVILGVAPHARIVDVTHGVPPQDVATGAFFLEHARRCFPRGTVHVAVVDPGVGSARALLVAEDAGHVFLGPDNGLLSGALSTAARVHELDVARFARPGASHTFHGRDVLAPAAAAIVSGLAPDRAGHAVRDAWIRLDPARPRRVGAGLEARVRCIDHYGNVILGAVAGDLDGPLERWSARVGTRVVPFARAYAFARPGEALLLVDSYGALELAVRDGDARATLGLAAGDHVLLVRGDEGNER